MYGFKQRHQSSILRSIIYTVCSHIRAQYFGPIYLLLLIQHIFIIQQHIHIMIISPCSSFSISYYSDMILVKTSFTITTHKLNLYASFCMVTLRIYVLFFTFYSELRHNLDTSGWYSIDINEKETTKFSFINLFHKLSSF